MTIPSDPRELASALVDGELSADQAARAAADPEVAALAAEMREVRAALRDVTPAPDIARETAIKAAVAAAGSPLADSGHPAPPPMAGRPRRRLRGPRPLLAAAAGILLLAVTAGLILQRSSDDGELQVADNAEPESADAGGDTEAGAGADAAPSETADRAEEWDDAETAPYADEPLGADETFTDGPVHLGSFDDADRLARAASDRSARDREMPAPAGDAEALLPTECPQHSVAGDPDRGRSLFTATAELDGEPVMVHVYPAPDDRLRVVATTTGCTDVVNQIIDD